ncbi:SusC/RagA family TonB-linked outer membrane protein [Dyadobacter psychrophilus]|uniref:TonB-linked outer membrane protein, SusC/RagA family n=1 Tax=Dyadobacter psychrophilus TaxID=651661 RepID=A0A1T5G612_9BACT|nr:TonB-dependent receptor [Dyadobacter psychrophilus]SKC03838.1 TonB-linked outer membrane protein, SusC/RagA family [Dyadobacter psychrophilus]
MPQPFHSPHLRTLTFGLLLLAFPGLAQTLIKGKVTSTNDQSALPGINVLIKGSTTGTTTNTEGFYELQAGDDAILVISGIGYLTQEIPVKRRSQVNVQLSDDTRQLNELVVVGYGTQKKRDLTGSVSSLDAKDFNKGVQTSVDQLIAGRSPGVQVTQSSSEPGGGVTIRIRGANSINANNEPLYVIDGLPINNTSVVPGSTVVTEQAPRNPLNALNPNDIESVEILKDASATAIYGSRGANGVILITTKKGVKGKLNVNYAVSGGISEVTKQVPVLNAKQYTSLLNDLRADQKQAPEFSAEQIEQIGDGTYWQDEIFRKGSVQNHQLSFSGGQDKFNYYASLNYLDQKGVVISSGIKKYTGRVNLNYTDDKFKFGLNLNSSNVKDDFVPNGVSVNEGAGVINTAIFQDPTLTIKNPNGTWTQTQIVNLENPVGLANEVSDFATTNRTFASVFAEYFFLPELSAKVNFGTDRQDSRRDIFTSRLTKRAEGTKGVANVLTSNSYNNLIEVTARYNKAFNKNHQLEILGGYTFQEFETSTLTAGAQNFPLDALGTDNLAAGAQSTFSLGTGRTKNQLLSYLGRVNYNLYDKYLLTASIRADGSSRFGDNNKYGVFPSVALGWRIKDELFLKNVNAITDLKFRASYGVTGNQDIGSYKSLVLLGPQGQAIFDGTPYVGISTTQLPNPDLKWETTTQLDLGIDFGVFDNRLTGSIDYFQKETKDLLLQLPVPRTTGFTTTFKNIGGLKNSGFELGLNSINITAPFTWRTSANFSTIKNEVTDLGALPFILGGSAGFTNDFTIIRKGDPLNAYYGYIVDGVFQTGDNIASSAQPLSRPGEYKYRDVNGDGTINSQDRTILGSPFPKFTYGLNNDFTYGPFNLSFFFQGVQGSQIFNLNRTESENPISFRRNRLVETYTDRWTPANPTNANSSAIPVAVAYTSNVNSRAVEDASYLRLKTLQLTYNFPTAKWKFVRNVQIYVTGQNLFTITKYTGYDPEVSAFGTSNVRADYNAFPLSRTYTAGLSINL